MAKPPKGTTITAKQRAWCRYVTAGASDTEAYKKAHKCSQALAEKNAWRYRSSEGVMRELDALKLEADRKFIATREKKRIRLGKIIEAGSDTDAIRAVTADNLMTGDNKPIKVEGEITLKRILDEIDDTALPSEEE